MRAYQIGLRRLAGDVAGADGFASVQQSASQMTLGHLLNLRKLLLRQVANVRRI